MKYKTLLFLAVLYLLYLLFGAGIFFSMERGIEIEQCELARAYKAEILNQTMIGNFTTEELNDLINVIRVFDSHGIDFRGEIQCPSNWDFQSSFFFSGTIITTIGYGHIAPTTDRSRLFCVLYALVGIPLFGIMFNALGQLFTSVINKLVGPIDHKNIPPWLKNFMIFGTFIFIGFVMFMCIPSAVFTYVEGWPYYISLYYCVITLTTIGFGDFVAGENPAIQYVELYRIMVFFWILFGLAFMITLIASVADRLSKTTKNIKREIESRRQSKGTFGLGKKSSNSNTSSENDKVVENNRGDIDVNNEGVKDKPGSSNEIEVTA